VSHNIASTTLRTSVVLAVRLGVQAGTLLVVTRLLGPEKFGAFAGVAALAVLLGALSSWGSHLVLLREMSRSPASGDAVLPFALGATLTCGSLLLLLFLACAESFLSATQIGLAVLLAIGAAEFWLQPMLLLAATDLLARGNIASSQLLQTLPLALRLAGAALIAMCALARPLEAYALVYVAASVCALLVGMRSLARPWPSPARWRLPTRQEWREAGGFAVLNITAAGPAELDKTLALRLLPLPVAGLYAASARVVGAATLPVVAMMLSALPRLFRRDAAQPQGTARLLRWIFAAAFGYSMVLTVALWLAAPLVEWLFGARYTGMRHMLQWQCLAVPGLALRIAAGSALMALGHPWMRAGFELAGLAVLAIAAVLLTARYGATGMPMALAASEWGMAILGIALTRRARPPMPTIDSKASN
jgi:O-antigen/teichoic acid export membrane protein